MKPKFSLGDSVWVRPGTADPLECPVKKETAAIVISIEDPAYICRACGSVYYYKVDVALKWFICECRLRPRQDDYQQHEGLGCLDGIRTLVLTKEETERFAKEPVDAPST